MPIVTVEIVQDEVEGLPRDLARLIADAVGRAVSSPPGQTWVRVRPLMRDQYAENDAELRAGPWPVFATILKREHSHGAEVDAEVAALTDAIARAVGRPAACVHVELAPAGAGRVAFGGKLVR